MGLTNEQIEALLKTKPKPKPKTTYVHPNYRTKTSVGPLGIFDTEFRCVSRGCSSPTHYKVQGIPYCHVHALRLLNEMLVAKGVLS